MKRSLTARVWRWNAYLIFITAILAIALLVFAAGSIIADELDDGETNVVDVAAGRVVRSETTLVEFAIVPGTNVLRAALELEQKLTGPVSSKDATSVQNYLFYDPATAVSYWLLDGPPTLLSNTRPLPSRDYSNAQLPITAFVYEQVERDTDRDERLTGADLKTIAVSDATGRRFTRLLRDVAEVHAAELTKDGIVIVYTAGGKMRAAHVEVTTFRVIRQTEVAVTPPAR